MQTHTEVDNFVSKKQLLSDLGISSINTLKTYAGCYGINCSKSEFSQAEAQAISHARYHINVQKMTVAEYKAQFCRPVTDDRYQSVNEPDTEDEDLIGGIASRFDSEDIDKMSAAIALRIAERIDFKVMEYLPNAIFQCVGKRFNRAINAVPHVMSLPSTDEQLAMVSIARSA